MGASTPHVSAPGLLDALCDVEAMELWELLRASPAACSAAELAGQSGRPLARTMAILDRLVDATLVERRPAGRGRHAVTFRTALRELRISYDGVDPQALRAMLDRWHRAQGDRFDAMLALRSGAASGSFSGVGCARLNAEERARLRTLLDQVGALMRNTEQRSREAQDFSGGGGTTRDPDARIYAVLMRVEDLAQEPLPYPNVKFVRSAGEPEPVPAPRGHSALSRRELQVAEALAAGMTRPEIAKQLGLSRHTVVTVSGRVYRKLGVHSRAELVRVMKV